MSFYLLVCLSAGLYVFKSLCLSNFQCECLHVNVICLSVCLDFYRSTFRVFYLYVCTLVHSKKIIKKLFWVKGRIRSCGFLLIFTHTDDRLWVYYDGPAGLEPPTGAEKLEKCYRENTDDGLFWVRLGYVGINDCLTGLDSPSPSRARKYKYEETSNLRFFP